MNLHMGLVLLHLLTAMRYISFKAMTISVRCIQIMFLHFCNSFLMSTEWLSTGL